VCSLHRARGDGEHEFLGLTSIPRSTVSPDLASKLTATVCDLGIKITVTVSWFEPQNQAGYSLSVVPQNRREDEDDVGHTSRSSGLLHLEASWARVSQSGLKTSGGAAQMVHVASSRRSCIVQAEDGRVDAMGCVRPCYPY
jgi:hypothetical protein